MEEEDVASLGENHAQHIVRVWVLHLRDRRCIFLLTQCPGRGAGAGSEELAYESLRPRGLEPRDGGWQPATAPPGRTHSTINIVKHDGVVKMSMQRDALVISLNMMKAMLHEINAELSYYEDLIKKRDRILSAVVELQALVDAPEQLHLPVEDGDSTNEIPRIVSSPYRGMSIVEAATTYLVKKGRPASNKEIAAELKRGGIQTNAVNFSNTIGGVLTRESKNPESRIVRGKRVWELKEWSSGTRQV